jgi:hypothetical protein
MTIVNGNATDGLMAAPRIAQRALGIETAKAGASEPAQTIQYFGDPW